MTAAVGRKRPFSLSTPLSITAAPVQAPVLFSPVTALAPATYLPTSAGGPCGNQAAHVTSSLFSLTQLGGSHSFMLLQVRVHSLGAQDEACARGGSRDVGGGRSRERGHGGAGSPEHLCWKGPTRRGGGRI